MNFQGRLDQSGQPAEGSKTFIFNIYDALSGGNLKWTSQPQAIDVANGVFSAVLSAGTTVDLSTGVFTGARFVEITVDGVSLSPRQEMVSAPYALVAQALAPDAVLPASTIADGSVTDAKVSLTTAAISSGRFSDDRVLITTGAFAALNGADQLVKLDSSGNLSLSGSVSAASMQVSGALSAGGAVSIPVKVVDFSDMVPALDGGDPTAVAYTLTANDSTLLIDGSANNLSEVNIQIILPSAASSVGRIYTIKRIDDDSLLTVSNSINLVPAGTDTVDGNGSGATYDVSTWWMSLTVQSAGNAGAGGTGLWVILSQF
jgi:hypothetical protein